MGTGQVFCNMRQVWARLPLLVLALTLFLFGFDFVFLRDLSPNYLSWYPFTREQVEPLFSITAMLAGAALFVGVFIVNQLLARLALVAGFVALLIWSMGFIIMAIAVQMNWIPAGALDNTVSRIVPALMPGALAMFLLLSATHDWSVE